MFSGKDLFKGIACPKAEKCDLLNCIFSHNEKQEEIQQRTSTLITSKLPHAQYKDDVNALVEGDRKRIKLRNGAKASVNPSLAKDSLQSSFISIPAASVSRNASESKIAGDAARKRDLKSMSRAISPPPKERDIKVPSGTKDSVKTKAIRPAETLNPRLVQTHPAPHSMRLELLRTLHTELSRLNKQVTDSKNEEHKKLRLSLQGVIKLALDEEEKVATTQPSVYRNVMGHTIVRFRKMKFDEWIELRLQSLSTLVLSGASANGTKFEQDRDLKPVHERLMISRFHVKLSELRNHGYIIEAPSQKDIDSTKAAIVMSDFWELCDRCGSRFQMFPERRLSDGAFTTGGTCKYHWGKPYKAKGSKEALRPCCGNPIGTPGCTEHDTHVFKTTDPKRLADVLQFKLTPENPKADPNLVVAFDCEMGYTTRGLEVIRVSATKWPNGEKLLDVLVRPVGYILDLNTRFSGVTTEQFLNAPDYDSNLSSTLVPEKLHIMSSPSAARDLLFSYVSPSTPLLGHAIENDLTILRVLHPIIIDTAILYPHRAGLPYRIGLKALTKEHLNQDIQIAGSEGHDSLEDAKATGDLVRAKVKQEWRIMKASGWTIDGDSFVPPKSLDQKNIIKALKYCEPPKTDWFKSNGTQAGEHKAKLQSTPPRQK
jgi:DNA polymerase III epsilon subunit-like protein